MKVSIKSFNIEQEIKANGIEFEVRSPQNDFLGDCFLTSTKLIWCKGKTVRENGVDVKWKDFMAICASAETLKAAVKAAKSV